MEVDRSRPQRLSSASRPVQRHRARRHPDPASGAAGQAQRRRAGGRSTRRAGRSSIMSASRSPRARRSASSGRAARASRRWCGRSPARSCQARGSSASTAPTSVVEPRAIVPPRRLHAAGSVAVRGHDQGEYRALPQPPGRSSGEDVDAAVVAAAQLAGAHDLILQLPGGYDYPLALGGQGAVGGPGAARGTRPRLVRRSPISDPRRAQCEPRRRGRSSSWCRRSSRSRPRASPSWSSPTGSASLPIIDRLMVIRDGRLVMFDARDEVLRQLAPPQPQSPPQSPSQSPPHRHRRSRRRSRRPTRE